MDAILKSATGRALTAVGLMLEGAAARLSPVGQYPKGSGRVGGRLRGSITHAVASGGSTPKNPAKAGDAVSRPTDDVTLHVGTNVEYAPHVEYGTVRMRAQPFLRPALDNNRKAMQALYAQELQRGLRDGK